MKSPAKYWHFVYDALLINCNFLGKFAIGLHTRKQSSLPGI